MHAGFWWRSLMKETVLKTEDLVADGRMVL